MSSSTYIRKYQNQDVESAEWKAHKKHIFILSSSGKPIYSRYGDESKQSSLLGLVQAFLSVFMLNDDDHLEYIQHGDYYFVFYISGPLYYVCASKTGETPSILQKQLILLHKTILFTLTGTQLERIFSRHSNFDLRSLLGGTDVLMDAICKSFTNPWIFLNAIPSIKLAGKYRKQIFKSWTGSNPPKALVFGALIANTRVVSLFPSKKVPTSPSDIALVTNLIYSSSSFKSVESWTPVCLPDYDSSAFLHIYSCMIAPELFMVLLSTDKDSFFEMMEYRGKFLENMENGNSIAPIQEAMRSDPSNTVELAIPGLRHLMIRNNTQNTCLEMEPNAPYNNSQERKRLLRLYQSVHSYLSLNPIKGTMSFQVTGSESVLVQKGKLFDVYLAFSPLIRKDAAHDAYLKIIEWLLQNQEAFGVF